MSDTPKTQTYIRLRAAENGGWTVGGAGSFNEFEALTAAYSDAESMIRGLADMLGVDIYGPKCGPDPVCSAEPELPISDEELRRELSKPAGIFIQTLDFEAYAEKLAEARAIIAGLLGAFASENHGDRARLAARAANFLAPV